MGCGSAVPWWHCSALGTFSADLPLLWPWNGVLSLPPAPLKAASGHGHGVAPFHPPQSCQSRSRRARAPAARAFSGPFGFHRSHIQRQKLVMTQWTERQAAPESSTAPLPPPAPPCHGPAGFSLPSADRRPENTALSWRPARGPSKNPPPDDQRSSPSRAVLLRPWPPAHTPAASLGHHQANTSAPFKPVPLSPIQYPPGTPSPCPVTLCWDTQEASPLPGTMLLDAQGGSFLKARPTVRPGCGPARSVPSWPKN